LTTRRKENSFDGVVANIILRREIQQTKSGVKYIHINVIRRTGRTGHGREWIGPLQKNPATAGSIDKLQIIGRFRAELMQ
jgi:hypothetical protein